jgi:hypothetical protein
VTVNQIKNVSSDATAQKRMDAQTIEGITEISQNSPKRGIPKTAMSP